jgi:hypothetical protein
MAFIADPSDRLNGRPRIVASYDYLNEAGTLLYQVVRWEPGFEGEKKTFRQRRPDGSGGWINGLGDVRRVLYRLPELIKADAQCPVFIVEGEKDADNLWAIERIATTCAMGAGKWRSDYNEALRGRHVAILPDNDDPGRKHAAEVARALTGIAASVITVELPNLPPKGDVSDWLAIPGNDGLALVQLLHDAVSRQPKAEPKVSTVADARVLRPTGLDVILEYFRAKYQPVFRRGNAIHSATLAREISKTEACQGAGKELVARLSKARDGPRKRGSLQRFFRDWAPGAWVEMIDTLANEEKAEEVDPTAGEAFVSLIEAGLLKPISLGHVMHDDKETRVEQRSLIDWCHLFAKAGNWSSVRSYKIWTRLANRRVRVAFRRELFGQIGIRQLAQLGKKKFAELCQRYDIGRALADEKPCGNRAIELDPAFIERLMAPPESPLSVSPGSHKGAGTNGTVQTETNEVKS